MRTILAEAIGLYQKAESVTHLPQAGPGISYARSGRKEDARRLAAPLIEFTKTEDVAADGIAAISVALGEER